MMKKKLLALMLVLCVASVANAGLLDLVIVSRGPDAGSTTPISPTKEITINQSEWLDLDIQFTGIPAEWLVQLSVEITAVGTGSLDLSTPTLPVGAWDMDPLYSPGIVEVVAGKQYLVTYSFGMAGAGIWGTDVPIPAIDHILFHCDMEDEMAVVITMTDYNSNVGPSAIYEDMAPGTIVWGDPVIVHQIPEPMTIALLGLGGLFLVRRRK